MELKTNLQESAQFIDGVSVVSVGEDNSVFANLAGILAETRKLKGVRGYILRNNTSAIIDLAPQDKVTDYAVLSHQVYKAGQKMAKHFKLTDIESMLVEGRDVKVLCMCIGENRIGIFMDKTSAHSWIIKRILL